MADVYGTDQFPRWQEFASAAQHDLFVVSPYFDEVAEKVLNSSTGGAQRRVLTNLCPRDDTSSSWARQIKAARSLIRSGVSVRTVPRLHAKLLLVDGEVVALGSQNFTTFGRSSKEASSSLSDKDKRSRLKASVDGWWENGTDVDEDLLDALESELSEPARELETQARTVEKLFTSAMEQHFIIREAELKRRRLQELKAALSSSPVRFVGGPIDCSIRRPTWEASLTLLVRDQRRNRLTEWPDSELTRLNEMPLMNTETGGLVFARIADTRVSYLRSRLTRSGLHQFGFREVEIELDPFGVRAHNFSARLSDCGSEILGKLSPSTFTTEVIVKPGSRNRGQLERIAQDDDARAEFLRTTLGSFKFKYPLSQRKIPLGEFLKGRSDWQIDRISLSDLHLLVAI